MSKFDGKKLKKLREGSGLKMAELLRQIYSRYGIKTARQTFYKWESGDVEPPLSIVATLADFFNVDPLFFLSK